MKRRIWIPDGMYRWLPRSAFAVGAAGILMSGVSFTLLIVSALTMGYGACVLVARALS